MKYVHLVFILLFPFASLFAQVNVPDNSVPDSLEVELEEQEIKDLNSGKAVVDESAVMEMLDLVGSISYFKDVYLDIDTAVMNIYDYDKDEVPLFDDSIYQQRIEALARKTTIPLTFNSHVKSFIELYSVRRRQQSSRMLGLSYVYFPMFEEYLSQYNLPLELKYLAMVESALNPTAGSKAGAKGLWQFMLGTGKYYGLRVTTLVDELRIGRADVVGYSSKRLAQHRTVRTKHDRHRRVACLVNELLIMTIARDYRRARKARVLEHLLATVLVVFAERHDLYVGRQHLAP